MGGDSTTTGKDFGEVHRLERQALTVDEAGQVHQAAAVVGHQVFGAGVERCAHFVFAHGHRDLWKLHRKRPAETAAQLVVLKLEKFQGLVYQFVVFQGVAIESSKIDCKEVPRSLGAL